MLYLVTIPGRSKRVQQNADSAEEAVSIIFRNLTKEHLGGALESEFFAEACPDPMSQFNRSDANV